MDKILTNFERIKSEEGYVELYMVQGSQLSSVLAKRKCYEQIQHQLEVSKPEWIEFETLRGCEAKHRIEDIRSYIDVSPASQRLIEEDDEIYAQREVIE